MYIYGSARHSPSELPPKPNLSHSLFTLRDDSSGVDGAGAKIFTGVSSTSFFYYTYTTATVHEVVEFKPASVQVSSVRAHFYGPLTRSCPQVYFIGLFAYEYVATIDQEVYHVWMRPFTPTSLLLLSTRWVMLINAFLPWVPTGPTQCEFIIYPQVQDMQYSSNLRISRCGALQSFTAL